MHENAEIWRSAMIRAKEERIRQAEKLGLASDSAYVTEYMKKLMADAKTRAGHEIEI